MSGFKENFHRDEDENLKYDDNAFFYFSFSILAFSLVPLTYFLVIRPMFFGEKIIKTSIHNCKCEICTDRMKKRSVIYKWAFIDKYLIMKIVLVTIGWILCYKCYNVVKDVEVLEGFVPHEILGIDAKAELNVVRKAYRKLSREKHPDKNPDNPKAVNEFI